MPLSPISVAPCRVMVTLRSSRSQRRPSSSPDSTCSAVMRNPSPDAAAVRMTGSVISGTVIGPMSGRGSRKTGVTSPATGS